jgi:hypothetical protein
MTRSRAKQTGRRESGTHFALPHAVMASPSYRGLSAHAVKLLCDLGGQYNGYNNGDSCAAWRIMQPLGWRSRDTLGRALAELLQAGMIEKTRQGGLNRCSLYALTWCAIDECKGKLDMSATHVPSGLWKVPNRAENQKASPATVSSRHGRRVSSTPEAHSLTRQAC